MRWQETRIPLAAKYHHQTYQACTPQYRNATIELWTPPIRCGAARHLYLDFAFALEEEGGCEVGGHGQSLEASLTIHLTEIDPALLRLWRQIPEFTIPIVLSRRFPGEYLCKSIDFAKIRDWLNFVVQQPLGLVSKESFYLGFRYRGPCFFLASTRVYYRQCQQEVVGLAHYPVVPGGSENVAGHCVENSETKGKPRRLCGEDGQWRAPTEVCSCLAGFEERERACKACKIGFFKSEPGNGTCQKCPANSHSISEGSLSCPCLHGFYRPDAQLPAWNCTNPPSAPENASFTMNGTWAILTWDLPRNWGRHQSGSFQISCTCHLRGNVTGWQPCVNLTYQPGQIALPHGPVSVGTLRPGVEYLFSIETLNSVSHLQNPPGKASAAVIAWFPENEHTTMQFVGPPEPALWGLSRILVPLVAGCLLTLLTVGVAVLWRLRRKKPYSTELQVDHAVRYRRFTVHETLQLLPIPNSLKQTLKDLVLDRNHLTLGRKLGTGEFGSVYEGALKQTGSQDVMVAVKTMKDGICTAEEMGSFMSEAALMKSFDHPNVLQLLGISFTDTKEQEFPMPLLVLPFMRHGDLRSFLLAMQHREVPMAVPLRMLVGFLVDIASGMDYLSSRGFIHRDLAARNCMLREDLRVCVADFGLSRKVYSKDYYRQGVVSRMPVKWMAIESITEYIYTPKTDVWSFGVTMWEVLSCGMTPYPGVQNHEMYLHLQRGNRMEKPPLCPGELYEAMCRCWQECPARRPVFSELLSTLHNLESSLPLGDMGGCDDDDDERLYVNYALLIMGACGSTEPDEEEEDRKANVYLPAPT
ncbi:tyrosine-protein kinase receptor UFO-like isoform X2 [Ambystoma mexicanum]|uniref:tyrosine-protein kinase receptor UFO-like isoform X2 n=1 Tax=Ambystoma mexicanum TaxID=8296 RepID=UPI0037E94AA6